MCRFNHIVREGTKVNSKAEPSMPVVVRFTCSREFAPTIEQAFIGKYRIKPIPSRKPIFARFGEELLLSFVDQWEEGQQHSNPIEESKYVLAWLSLALRARIEYRASKINNVDVDVQQLPKYKDFVSRLEAFPLELDDLYHKLLSLDERLLRQYTRCCLVYQSALSMLEDSPTLTFFLLVVAIECLSNIVVTTGRKSERFIQFIKNHMPAGAETTRGDEALFAHLLGRAYYYRSGFTHGGESIPEACLLADQAGYNYVKHYVEGKEAYSPGLGWLEKVVHTSLIEFLRRQKLVEKPNSDLADLARQTGIIEMKTKRPVQSGRVVTSADVDAQ